MTVLDLIELLEKLPKDYPIVGINPDSSDEGLAEHCGDDERIPSRAVEQGLENDLWVNTARLNTIYIPME